MPGDAAFEMVSRLGQARDALDRLEAARQHAEHGLALKAMPFTDLDDWTRTIRAELTALNTAVAEWAITARDIDQNV